MTGTVADALTGAALAAALSPLLGDDVRVEGLERLSGGASRETWRFDAVVPGALPRALVLRRDPPHRPSLPGGMGLEARAIRAAHAAGLAVPEVLLDDDTPESFGTAGMVMTLVPGETIARRILRDDAYQDARDHHLARQCGEFLAGLHAIPTEAVPGLAADDPLDGLRHWYGQVGQPNATFEMAFRWLEERRPASAGPAVVHGDFRLGNLIVGEEGLRAVLDWELAHLGDPLEDLGWLCTKAWRFGASPPVGGFGDYKQLVDAYEGAGGRTVEPDALRWWEVYGTLRWGVICMGQAAAHLFGAVRSVELAAIGRRVCEQEWDLLGLIAPVAVEAVGDDSPDGPVVASGLHGRPTAVELLEAVGEYLDGDVAGSTEGRVRFHSRVAGKVVAMVARELSLARGQEARYLAGLAQFGAADEAELAAAIRDGGHADRIEELAAFLATTARDRLAVANPAHLSQ